MVIAIPLGLLGACNLAPHPVVYLAARRVMDLLRAVNEFVFALMFVTAVGLGSFAGMLALGLHTGGVLGKLLSETAEVRRSFVHDHDAAVWDIAGAAAVLLEAGGVITDPDGRPLFPLAAAQGTEPFTFVAGNPTAHRRDQRQGLRTGDDAARPGARARTADRWR